MLTYDEFTGWCLDNLRCGRNIDWVNELWAKFKMEGVLVIPKSWTWGEKDTFVFVD